MEHSSAAAEDTHHHDAGGTKEIWRTFWILLGLTIVELVLGYIMIGVESPAGRMALKGAIIILMLAKAFYIVAYFMHLKGEIRNLVMTILVPLSLLVWAIMAFLYEGYSYNSSRNTYDPYYKENGQMQVTGEKHHEKEMPEKKRTGAME